jgi:hypothetical protein
MGSRFEPPRDNPLRPMGSVDDVTEDATEGPDGDGARRTQTRRMDALPEHERDENDTVGGGVLGMGGTSIDRGTGTTDGQAQGEDDDDDVGPGVRLDDADAALGLDRDDDR